MWMRRLLISCVAAVLLFSAACLGFGSHAFAQDIAASHGEQAVLDDLTAQYHVLARQQRFEKAIPTAQHALKLTESLFGPDHPQVAQVLNDIGFFHQSLAQYRQAEPLHQRALAIRERVFSSDGPAVVQSMTNLAKVYVGEERYGEAVDLFARAIDILERHIGPETPALAVVLEPFSVCLRALGRLQEADEAESKVQRLRAAPRPTVPPVVLREAE